MNGLGSLLNDLESQQYYYRLNLNGAVMTGDMSAAEADAEADKYWLALLYEYGLTNQNPIE